MMRKQYHFWPGRSALDAWDVDRLLLLTEGLPPKRIPLASIDEIDTVYWFDDKLERPTVRKVVEHVRLIEEVDLKHPIILSEQGHVMDGMHRIAKALLHGETHIWAVQFETDPEPDFRNVDPEDLPYDR